MEGNFYSSDTDRGPHIIRLAHPLAFVKFLKHIGAPAERYLQLSDLPVFNNDPDAFVPLPYACTFFDHTARAVDPEIGWRVGEFVGHQSLNTALRYRVEHATTLTRALLELVRHANSEASSLRLGVAEADASILLYPYCVANSGNLGHLGLHCHNYLMPVILSVIRHYLGRDWVPSEISLVTDEVPRAAEYIFPDSRILAGQKRSGIRIPRSLLKTAPPAANTHPGRLRVELTDDFGYEDKLRAVLRPYLGEGYPPAKFAAALMGTSTRTLARRLAVVALSYHEVVDDLRFSEAKIMLTDSSNSISDVAFAVGFEDPAHFTRMFRRVSGVTPRDYRASLN